MTEAVSWRLATIGRMPWQRFCQVAPVGLTWCWIDLDGYQVGEVPTASPIGTHMWGWSDCTWVRARIDRGTVRAAALHLTSEPLGGPVEVHCGPGLPWADDEQRLSNAGRATMATFGGLGSPYILTAGVVSPITFLHYGAAPITAPSGLVGSVA